MCAGEVIKPDTFKCITDEGMPIHGRPFQKGNMYVHFVVVFPERIDPALVRCVFTLGCWLLGSWVLVGARVACVAGLNL